VTTDETLKLNIKMMYDNADYNNLTKANYLKVYRKKYERNR